MRLPGGAPQISQILRSFLVVPGEQFERDQMLCRCYRFPRDGVEGAGLREQRAEGVDRAAVVPLAHHGQPQPCRQRLPQGGQRPFDVLPRIGRLVLDPDDVLRDSCGGEQPGELAALHDAGVPVDTSGGDQHRRQAAVIPLSSDGGRLGLVCPE